MRKVVQNILKENEMTFDDLKEVEVVKIKVPSFDELNIKYRGKECGMDTYSVAHNYVQMGDVITAPKMEFFHFSPEVEDRFNYFYPSSYQADNTIPPKFERVVECRRGGIVKPFGQTRVKKLITFANQWASNLKKQGFIQGKCSLIDGTPCKEYKK